jgi:hypothetical protein
VPHILCTCPFCGTTEQIFLTDGQARAIQEGTLIQHAAPNLTDGQRERLITGTCDPCWNQRAAEAWRREQEETKAKSLRKQEKKQLKEEKKRLAELQRLELLIRKTIEISIRRGAGRPTTFDMETAKTAQEAIVAYNLLLKLRFVYTGEEFFGLSSSELERFSDALRKWLELTLLNVASGDLSETTWRGPDDSALVELANGIAGLAYIRSLIDVLVQGHGESP